MNAIAMIESSNNPKAVGSSGEIGLYQISPIVLKHHNQWLKEHDEHLSISFVGTFPDNKALFNPKVNEHIANWYLGWLYDRCWTIKDTIIAYNWGIGNWRKGCFSSQGKYMCDYRGHLPKVTENYLKKYELLTGEKL